MPVLIFGSLTKSAKKEEISRLFRIEGTMAAEIGLFYFRLFFKKAKTKAEREKSVLRKGRFRQF